MGIACAYQFTIHPPPGHTASTCLDAIRNQVVRWVCKTYRQMGHTGVAIPFDGSCQTPHAGHTLSSDQQHCETHRLATLEWGWPDRSDPNLCWLFACAVACDEVAVEVALQVQLAARTFILRPVHFHLDQTNPLSYMPTLAARLVLDWPCEVAGQRVPTQHRLLRPNDLDAFLHQTLLCPTRVLPVVLLSPDNTSGLGYQGLAILQDQLLGLAEVVGLANRLAGERLTALLGPERDCREKALRLYWPGFSHEAPPQEHPLFSAQELLQMAGGRPLEKFLLGRLLDLGAAYFREGELIRAARRSLSRDQRQWRRTATEAAATAEVSLLEARQLREERDRLRQEATAAHHSLRTWQAEREAQQRPAALAPEADELLTELERCSDENRRLKSEAERYQRRLAELEADLRNHQENWETLARGYQLAGARAPEPAPPAAERHFATVADALRAASELSDVLEVWEDAVHSAAASPYAAPAKVLQALQAIAELGRAYFAAKDGGTPLGPIEQFFQARVPFKYAGFESTTTLNLYGQQRVFHHNGRALQMQRHLTLGGGTTNNCLQIYFEFDDERHRVLIGYCGRHLPYHGQRT
jgi:hypothetical protein